MHLWTKVQFMYSFLVSIICLFFSVVRLIHFMICISFRTGWGLPQTVLKITPLHTTATMHIWKQNQTPYTAPQNALSLQWQSILFKIYPEDPIWKSKGSLLCDFMCSVAMLNWMYCMFIWGLLFKACFFFNFMSLIILDKGQSLLREELRILFLFGNLN